MDRGADFDRDNAAEHLRARESHHGARPVTANLMERMALLGMVSRDGGVLSETRGLTCSSGTDAGTDSLRRKIERGGHWVRTDEGIQRGLTGEAGKSYGGRKQRGQPDRKSVV